MQGAELYPNKKVFFFLVNLNYFNIIYLFSKPVVLNLLCSVARSWLISIWVYQQVLIRDLITNKVFYYDFTWQIQLYDNCMF